MALLWSDDLSKLSFEEVLTVETENRAWRKRLREGTTAVVNARLAKSISQEEYAASRERASHDSAECKRRGELLDQYLGKRHRRQHPPHPAPLV